MRVIICGAGQVGWQIARHLSGEGNEICVVDTDPDLVRHATETLDVDGVVGFASYPDVLERAGARDADMIIAATQHDEVNMVTCQIAHSIFAVQRKIARLRARSYFEVSQHALYHSNHLPIDVIISPEREVAEAAVQRLAVPSAFDTETFLDGQAILLGLAIDAACPVLNTPLRQLSELFSTLNAVVVGIRRKGKLFVPRPSDEVLVDDEAYVFTTQKDLKRTLEAFGKVYSEQRRVVIIGGGPVGLGVAEAIERMPGRLNIKLIEANRAVAEEVANSLERTVVLHGDGLSAELLDEAGIAEAGAVLALTNDDKTNLLVSVRAKQLGCPMAIALINDNSLAPLLAPLGVDAYLNPRATTVSSILRHVRHGRVRWVYSIGDAEAEMIEAVVLGSSLMAGQRIRDISFPDGVIVAGVLKGTEFQKPHGDLRVVEGDIICLFSMARDIPEVERLLQVSIDFY